MKFKEEQFYIIEFDDHVLNSDQPAYCQLVGKVIKQCDTYVVFCVWDILNAYDDNERNSNREIYSIVKACIRKKKLVR